MQLCWEVSPNLVNIRGGYRLAELANCSRCNNVFVKNVRDICRDCFMEEEAAFETVYKFLRQRKNREATLIEIVEATGVEEELIIKFMREKRLRASEFPKLAYPCERCGKSIVTGKMCQKCADNILQGFAKQEQMDALKKEHDQDERINVYYTLGKHKK